jgi:hypothetical protein
MGKKIFFLALAAFAILTQVFLPPASVIADRAAASLASALPVLAVFIFLKNRENEKIKKIKGLN